MTAHLSDELLQRQHDGELEPSEQSQVHTHLAECSACEARLAGLGRLSGLIRMAARDAATDAALAEQVDWKQLYARIEQRAEQPTSAAAEVRDQRAQSRPGAAVQSLDPARRRRRAAAFSVTGALAAAAAVLLMIFQNEPPARDESRDDGADTTLAVMPRARSEITQVDFGSNAGTVFDIALADGSYIPVVWINDDDEAAQTEEM